MSRRPQLEAGRASGSDNGILKQSDTRPISQEQLVAEVKGIYAGLVMVESKCIEVDSAANARMGSETTTKLNDEQWRALICLHRTLLHEHYDFFLASQHPSASPALRKLGLKYAMPARMWRHGIHSFLELLRHRLPHPPEHMFTFIYHAYAMMRDDTLNSCECAVPARLWRPGIHSRSELLRYQMPHFPEHILMFIYLTNTMMKDYVVASSAYVVLVRVWSFATLLSSEVLQRRLPDSHVHMLTFTCSAVNLTADGPAPSFDLANPTTMCVTGLSKPLKYQDYCLPSQHSSASSAHLETALALVGETDTMVFKRYDDGNVLPYLSIRLSFMSGLAGSAMRDIDRNVPWKSLAKMFIPLVDRDQNFDHSNSDDFPKPNMTERPLCDDWNLRGLLWTETLFPSDWLTNDEANEDAKAFQLPSMTKFRRERVLWLGWRLAAHRKWVVHDDQTKQSSTVPQPHQHAHAFGDCGTMEEWPDFFFLGSFLDDDIYAPGGGHIPANDQHTLLSSYTQWMLAGKSMLLKFTGGLAAKFRHKLDTTRWCSILGTIAT